MEKPTLIYRRAAVGNKDAIPIQYTQKQRKPGQAPNSCRVQRYNPPAPGYFATSAATATARGTINNTAAKNQSVTEPGPACAAIGIHRAEVMQVMANSVRSRSPSSRLSVGLTDMCAQDTLVGRACEASRHLSQELCGSSWPVLLRAAAAQARRDLVAQASSCVLPLGRDSNHTG